MDKYTTRTREKQVIIDRECKTFYGESKALSKEQAVHYEENGYIVLKGFFDKDKIKALKSKTDSIFNRCDSGFVTVDEPTSKVIRSALGVHESEVFNGLITKSSLPDISKEILGGDTYVHQSRINFKQGMESIGWSWHSDFETWHSQDGMPLMRCFTAMIPIDSNTASNGALMVIPKSHKKYVSCPKPNAHSDASSNFADQKEGLPDKTAIDILSGSSNKNIKMLECDEGDLVLFDCNLMHVSGANVSSVKRTNLFFVINSVDNMLEQPYIGVKPRPEEMGARERIFKL